MSALPSPDHLVTLVEWQALPEDNRFWVEVVEGVLIASPRPPLFHQWAVARLGDLVHRQLPERLSAASELEIVLTAKPLLTVRVPDVVVLDTALALTNPARCAPGDVYLAVEVLSEGIARTDRVTKFAGYAEAGIANYWIVDLGSPVSLIRYQLIDGECEMFGEHTATVTLELEGSPITLDLNALTTRQPQRH